MVNQNVIAHFSDPVTAVKDIVHGEVGSKIYFGNEAVGVIFEMVIGRCLCGYDDVFEQDVPAGFVGRLYRWFYLVFFTG
jgi:hypothetical protein